MKKILVYITVLLLTGCSSIVKDNGVKVSTYITNEMKEKAEVSQILVDYVEDYHTYEYLNKNMTNLVIATIVSVDNATMYEGGLYPYTEGQAIVQKTLYGDSLDGKNILYARGGGIITVAQYDQVSPEEAVEKRDRLREESGITNFDKNANYMNFILENDIEIEAGKTYLMYLHSTENGTYEIFGVEAGLREVDVPVVEKASIENIDISSVNIKDNTTNEFISLQEYLNSALPQE